MGKFTKFGTLNLLGLVLTGLVLAACGEKADAPQPPVPAAAVPTSQPGPTTKGAEAAMVTAVTPNLPPPPRLDQKRPAPDFDNQTWLNSPRLSLTDLQDKVVLVEFWTFGCSNCRNVQPALKRLYADYSSKGFEIVAFHDPEFDYEKKLENVQNALSEGGIKYPVAIDNDFKTWGKYGVRAWPTLFLVDKQGQIRYTHIGEGAYEETEAALVALLNEKG